jgi:lactoylglutathione lyase
MMSIKLTYAIKFVGDMDRAVKFYRDTLGLKLKFESPKWTEFLTGDTILALHFTTDKKTIGTVRLGFGTENIDAMYSDLKRQGVIFTRPPEPVHDAKIAEFIDSEGVSCSLGE